jgi:hypothetical protein
MEMERCRREIAAIETELLGGNPEVEGLILGLVDWHMELRILLGRARIGNAEASRRIENVERVLRLSDRADHFACRIHYINGNGSESGFTVISDIPELRVPYRAVAEENGKGKRENA